MAYYGFQRDGVCPVCSEVCRHVSVIITNNTDLRIRYFYCHTWRACQAESYAWIPVPEGVELPPLNPMDAVHPCAAQARRPAEAGAHADADGYGDTEADAPSGADPDASANGDAEADAQAEAATDACRHQ